MTRLSEAQAKLDHALARLEKASVEQARPSIAAESEIAAELEVARARCSTLEDQARIVSERLNATIGRVRALLDR